ncbi:MAG: hypothetical protein IJK81_02240 [Selenomonadaceae bacterium]|nr:hypothetical protein [Selenomonadaceae bacterium]
MNKGKIFIGLGVGIVLLIMLAAASGTSTPKNIGQFISNYNKEIQKVADKRAEGPGKGVLIGRCSINNLETAINGSKVAAICNENGGFVSYDYQKSFTVGFALSKSISSNLIFSIIEAAILASGDDYNSVMKSLGVMSGNQYSIPGEYNREITFNKNKYFLTSVDDMILLNISIQK